LEHLAVPRPAGAGRDCVLQLPPATRCDEHGTGGGIRLCHLRAGYAQPDFLFYVLFFATFLACWNLLRGKAGLHSLVWASSRERSEASRTLTKAVVPPFIAVFLAVYGTNEIVLLARSRVPGRRKDSPPATVRLALDQWTGGRRVLPGGGVALHSHEQAVCLASTSSMPTRRTICGTTMVGGTGNHLAAYRPSRQDSDLARTPDECRKYWRTHTLGQIGGRVVDGLIDTAVRSYRTFWYLKFVVLYVGFVLLLAVAGWRHTVAAMRHHAALVTFLSLYAAVYLVGTGFFVATSGTGGTRFILAHVAPLLFVASHVISSSRLRSVPLALGGVSLTPTHFHALCSGRWDATSYSCCGRG